MKTPITTNQSTFKPFRRNCSGSDWTERFAPKGFALVVVTPRNGQDALMVKIEAGSKVSGDSEGTPYLEARYYQWIDLGNNLYTGNHSFHPPN